MPRDNAARGWTPGDAILFSPDGKASSSVASTSKMAATTRQPLAAMKNAKQGRKLSEEDVTKPKEKQTTLSPWTKAAWKPGMRVLIATSSSKQSTMIEKSNDSGYRSKKGKEKAVEAQVDKRSTNPGRKTARLHQQEHVPFQSYNIYEDPSPSSSPHRKTSRVAYDTTEDSLSSIKAVINEDSQIDPDSSIEFLGQRADPRANALRHLALAQANFLEASKATTSCTTSSTFSIHSEASNSQSVAASTVVYRRRRINFVKSPSPSPRRSFSATSYMSDEGTVRPSAIDWDDPILNPAASESAASDNSDSSDLPELPFSKSRPAVPPGKTWNSTSSKSSAASTSVPSEKLSAVYPASKAKPRVEPAKLRELKTAGRQYAREDKEVRERRKAAEQVEMKNKYRAFSYDTATGTTPKIWYFRGLASGKIKFMGCDTRQGYVTDQPRNMEDLIRQLKGPLGWDLEWEVLTWNETYSSKGQGKVALIQLGDKNNIILFQIERGSNIPECLLEVIEDPSVIKLGVQIKGDAQKISRDYTWPDGRPILPKGLLDLSHFARHVHPQEVAQYGNYLIGLQRLVAIYLDAYLEKGKVRTSKWESAQLSSMQRKYAANDIFASVQVYQRVLGLAETDGISVDFETLLVNFSARLDPQTGKLRDIVSKIRKGKPAVSRKKSTTSETAPRIVATSLSPRVYEAWETWALQELERDEVAEKMNVKESTVTNYILKALITDPELEYDVGRLRTLLKGMVVPNFQKAQVEQLLLQQPPAIDE